MFDESKFFAISKKFVFEPETLPMNQPEARCHLILPKKIQTPIIVSAPHAVEHIRDGNKKFAEADTAALVFFLVQELKCAGIVNIDGQYDPNFDEDKPYCDVMEEIISNFNLISCLDIHESSPKCSYSFAIGTGYGANVNDDANIAPALQDICERLDVHDAVIDMHPYASAGKNRVATTINRRCGIPAIQLETNSGFFFETDPRFAPELAYKVIRNMAIYLSRLQ